MSLHPGVAAWLAVLKDLPATHTLPVDVVRANMVAVRAMMPPPPAVGHVADRAIPGPGGPIPVRLYTPFGIGPFPLTVYFHGGGFVLGNLDSHDSVCRHLCLNSGGIVMAVDYRLAPEHPFPAAPDDCYAATRWAGEHAAEIGAAGGASRSPATAPAAISRRWWRCAFATKAGRRWRASCSIAL